MEDELHCVICGATFYLRRAQRNDAECQQPAAAAVGGLQFDTDVAEEKKPAARKPVFPSGWEDDTTGFSEYFRKAVNRLNEYIANSQANAS